MMDHQLRSVRAMSKIVLCSFSWALSEKESNDTSSDEVEHFLKEPDSNALDG